MLSLGVRESRRFARVMGPLAVVLCAVLSSEAYNMYLVITGKGEERLNKRIASKWGYYSEGNASVIVPPISLTGYVEREKDETGDGRPDDWSVLAFANLPSGENVPHSLLYNLTEEVSEGAGKEDASFTTGDRSGISYEIAWTKKDGRILACLNTVIGPQRTESYVDLDSNGTWDVTQTILKFKDGPPRQFRNVVLNGTILPVVPEECELPLDTVSYTVRLVHISGDARAAVRFENGLWRNGRND